MTGLAIAAVAASIAALCGFVVWLVVSAKRGSEAKARIDAQIKDMKNAAKIHKAAADARTVQPDTPVDQRLRDLGRLRD